ncbi:MAG: DJ-1/PfpI family protein [Arachidicoccus sp.]|nr:DJ-1/PfpI family protein [Arachidicoccus sp.]
MKNLIMILLCCSSLIAVAQQKTDKKIKVAIVAYPGMELIDYSGPTDVFGMASEITEGQYSVYTVAENPQPVKTVNTHTTILPDYSFYNMPKPDILVIPGGDIKNIDSLISDKRILSLIKKYNADSSVKIMSVCTGAYLLAATGLLNNKRATTHFFVTDDFAERFPSVTLVKNVRYVDEGNIITSSGVTSGIDAALHVVKENSGEYVADIVARALQYTPHEKEAWPQPLKKMHYKDSSVTKNVCAVCGMKANGKIETEYKGKTYYFCSDQCKNIFLRNPDEYVSLK